MIIENVDTLKVWLIKTLEPICDADPAALAKYVIALAKKDKPQPELRALCEDQLDVFLGDETKVFVGELFDTLNTKSYMQQGLVVPTKVEPPEVKAEEVVEEQKGTKRKSFEEADKPENSNEGDKVLKTENKPDVGKIRTLECDKENVGQKVIKKEPDFEASNPPEMVPPQTKPVEKPDKEPKPLRMSTRQSIKREVEPDDDNVSMRSASVDRSVKSMSPAVAPPRTRHVHSSRRKSSRSPNRNSGGRHTRSSRRDRPRREHHDRSRDPRNSRRNNKDNSNKEKEKCRDYEEKGFCMLGEVCPYDHGYDPVEVDDRNLPQMLTLAGLPPAPPTNPPPPPQQLLIPNVLPPPSRPLAPLSNGISLNTGLTTVQVQNTRPIPSPAEMPNHQVPIFRPRNPIAFMRNLSPQGGPVTPVPVTPVSQQVVPAVGLPAKTTDDIPRTTNNAYNPEDPSIEVGVANSLKNAMKTQSLPSVPYHKDSKSDEKSDRHSNNKKKLTVTIDEDNRTQDELVQIAMGNVPLSPIVGSQQIPFSANNVQLPPPPPPPPPMQPPVLLGHQFRPELIQPNILPMSLTVQQQYHQLQIQQHQAAALVQQQQQQQQQHQQQQQQQALQTIIQNSNQNSALNAAKPYRRNTVLELRKIPAPLNNIVQLSEFFQKFGIITRVQTPYDNDVQAALMEFSQHQEAVAAYNCPDAILGNRFIKMFWHNPNRPKLPPNHGSAGTDANITLARQDSYHRGDHRGDVRPKKIPSSEELIYINPKTDPKLIQMQKKKELDKLKVELLKKKQTHYEELAKKQKEILAKLEKENVTKEEKARLFKAFKHADAAVQKLRKELYAEAMPKQVAAPVRNIVDAKKAILDKEIDIYHGNLDGEELVEAKKALATLKREANFSNSSNSFNSSSDNPFSNGPRGGRGGFRGRGRGRGWFQSGSGSRGRGGSRGTSMGGPGGMFSARFVDNRPKQIVVSGYDLEEKDDVVAHFATFGQLDRIEEHDENKMKLTFPTRKSAEMAAMQGRTFRGKQLILSWFTPPTTSTQQQQQQQQPPTVERTMTRSLSQSLMDKDLDDDLLELDKEEEEMLLADVEDDDDDDDVESDERSWRR